MARTVVIAEDEAVVRLDLCEILAEEGFEVVGSTGRGDEAVELVRNLHPDLVILDIKMPGMDGLQAAAAIHSSVRTAVVILTAFSERNFIERARDAGAQAYLVKPFQREELLPAIEVALGRFAEAQALEAEFAALSDDEIGLAQRRETRLAVDRAKGLLMDDHSMTEPEAFAFIEKSAKERGQTIRGTAQAVADGSLAP
ncbi:MAG: response regulator [Acidimicrobiales bacterium]